ncbi:hypothetical protein VTO42DRAFT_4237 [Malbranchea cinnamomea]
MSSDSPNPSPTILISGLPPKTLVGIDLLSFTSTPNFHGIRDLPAGAHFLYTGTTESFSLRCGEWLFVSDNCSGLGLTSAEIRLRKWNGELEALVPVDERKDEERQEAMERRANLGSIWHAGGLLAYRTRWEEKQNGQGEAKEEGLDADTLARGDWQRLTEHITPAVLDRILGPGELGSEQKPRWIVTSASSAPCDVDNIPGLSSSTTGAGGVAGEQEKELHFLPIDLKKTWREGAIGRERTEAALDKSWALGNFVDSFKAEAQANQIQNASGLEPGEVQCLGEMQFTFLMVLTLMNFSCLEQWKRLLSLFLKCRAAIVAREEFFVRMLQILRIQLAHCNDVEGGLFEMDGDDGGTMLKKLLTGFCRSVDDVIADQQSRVKSELIQLEEWVKKEFGWELRKGYIVRRGMLELEDGEQVEMDTSDIEEEEETGEYAPVVVDLENVGRSSEDLEVSDMPDP